MFSDTRPGAHQNEIAAAGRWRNEVASELQLVLERCAHFFSCASLSFQMQPALRQSKVNHEPTCLRHLPQVLVVRRRLMRGERQKQKLMTDSEEMA
jgi:hypothetical protein